MVKCSEAQGRDREETSEGSVEQSCEPTDRNRIQGERIYASEQVIAKRIAVKRCGRKFGGRAAKVVELTVGDLHCVHKTGNS